MQQRLKDSAKTQAEREAIYGENYKQHGKVMTALFPKGVLLETVHDFNRFGVLNMKVAKLTRYCQNFSNGGHPDSIHDDVVYSAILEELDDIG